jgi:hypothetical protein
MVGRLRKYRPVEAAAVASAMVRGGGSLGHVCRNGFALGFIKKDQCGTTISKATALHPV